MDYLEDDKYLYCEWSGHLELDAFGDSVERLRRSRMLGRDVRIVGLSPYGFKMYESGGMKNLLGQK